MLLDFHEGDGSIEEIFGVTFTASLNPLIDNNNDNSIYERITRLEEQQRSNESHVNHRLNQLEKSYENIYHIVDKSNIEMKDLERNILQLQSKLTTTNGLLDVLQNENDSKRSVIAKMDSWIRQVNNNYT